MQDDPAHLAIRFGTGLSPDIPPPSDAADMLARLFQPDQAAADFPIPSFSSLLPRLTQMAELRKTTRQNRGTPKGEAANTQLRAMRRDLIEDRLDWLRASLARSVLTSDGFRERLTRFWADHFTVRIRSGELRYTHAPYVEEAIRPNIAGTFSEMLKAAVLHPMMLVYLDQHISVGPSTPLATRRNRGLNENLAREVLELHTLGVGGPYTQDDVRQLAELFTGLTVQNGDGMVFRPAFAEPGAESVLGQSYGGGEPALADVIQVLDDLAHHPATAQHVARKLALHFISDEPVPELIAHMAARFEESGGHLPSVYEAMLEHPGSQFGLLEKAKQPMDFITSAFRALGTHPRMISTASRATLRRLIVSPLQVMGQPLESPPGPDGWPEDASAWITPQGLAARIQWAMLAPRVAFKVLPDPRAFVDTALGPFADDALRFAAAGAELRSDGVGLVLSSPAFQRR